VVAAFAVGFSCFDAWVSVFCVVFLLILCL